MTASPTVQQASTIAVTEIPIKWHSELPVYASESFLKEAGDECGWLGGTDPSGRLRCILPFTVLRKAGFRIVRFRVETIPVGGELKISDERLFLNSVITYLRTAGIHLIVPASNNTIFRTYPEGALAAPYGTFINDLQQPEAVLWRNVSEAYRKDIRRAIKNGVEIRSGREYIESTHAVVTATLKRSGLKFKSLDEFRRLIESLKENARIFAAIHQGEVQAALLAPFSGCSAYTLYGGTIAGPVKGAMHLLHWEAMRQFQTMGVKQFNFTGVRINPEKGSKQEGIYNFKERFGGQLAQGFMWKYPLRRIPFAGYCAAVRLLKGGDVVDRERHKMPPGAPGDAAA